MSLPNYYVSTLAQSLATGGSESEVYVNSINTADGQTIAITDFAIENSIGYLIVDPQSSANVEYISFTGVDGSGIGFTGAVRGLSFKGDGSVITANKLFHSAGATVIIGWSSNDLNSFVNKYTAQTINGTLTFTVPPTSGTLPTVSTQVANKAYVDQALSGTLGTATTLSYGTVKISTNPATPNAPIAVGDNDGRVPTQSENDALVGNNGTSSSTNTFVTQTGRQLGTETFAIASGTSIAYAVTLNPVLTSYKPGTIFRFYAPFASGTTPTVNINGLGAKTLYKWTGTGTVSLALGDIGTNSFVQVGIDSGLGLQLLAPIPKGTTYNSNVTTRDISTTGAQTIAHGLGQIPRYIRISTRGTGAAPIQMSDGSYNGTTVSMIYQIAAVGGTYTAGNSNTNIVQAANEPGLTNEAHATVGFDATNITLTWAKTNSPTGTLQILWEAFA